MNVETTRLQLKEQLAKHGITILEENDKQVLLASDYTIEIENASLFKLLHANQVVAPFDDMQELCAFIRMDMQLNV